MLFGLFPARSMRQVKLCLEHVGSTSYLDTNIPSHIDTSQETSTSFQFPSAEPGLPKSLLLGFSFPFFRAPPAFSFTALLFQGLMCRFAFVQLYFIIGFVLIAPKLLTIDKVSAVTDSFTGFSFPGLVWVLWG